MSVMELQQKHSIEDLHSQASEVGDTQININLEEDQVADYEGGGGSQVLPEESSTTQHVSAISAEESALKPLEIQEQKPHKDINYAFLDGLRGFGSFAVYLSHLHDQFFLFRTKEENEQGADQRHFPDWMRSTPFRVIYHGYFWVIVFFILSGFVLPLRFFKTGKETCITGGTFRRYLRLMLPVLMINSLYYLFMKVDAMGVDTFPRLKHKTFMSLIRDCFWGTWFGDDSWTTATWTMSIEFFATFFVYLLSQTAVKYRYRFLGYLLAVIFILFPISTNQTGLTQYKIQGITPFIPVFFFGVVWADLETLKPRPLDRIRNLSMRWKIPMNLVLFIIIISWGGYSGDDKCVMKKDGQCPYFIAATFGQKVPKLVTMFVAANLLIFVALTSSVFQAVLGSAIVQFMGRISFALYLVHELFIEWMMVDTYLYFLGLDVEPNLAILYCILIYTPILILVSWLLTVIVDAPSKDFAYAVDIQARKERPPPPKDDENQDPEVYYSCLNFTKRSWKIVGFVIWLILLAVIGAIAQALKSEQLSTGGKITPNMETLGWVTEQERIRTGQKRKLL